MMMSCILFHFYIKPQHAQAALADVTVVSYSISTSNHNSLIVYPSLPQLYLIPFLHQTTTLVDDILLMAMLYLIPFLHQTTTSSVAMSPSMRCILFHFYIKPQRKRGCHSRPCVVSYSISTSNHNQECVYLGSCSVVSYSISTSNHNTADLPSRYKGLYLIPFLHQTTTLCLDLRIELLLYLIPFLHQTTTLVVVIWISFKLYLIPFLHQTTTFQRYDWLSYCCILFHFYIKPQHVNSHTSLPNRCILFHFYIKPQQTGLRYFRGFVVSYSISTSNHNLPSTRAMSAAVVSYSISTSNHNGWVRLPLYLLLYLIPFLHQTTTLS